MAEQIATARIVDDGDRQIVELPEAFRLPGPTVQVRRSGGGLLLEPIRPMKSREEVRALLDKLKRLAAEHGPFMPEGREQPPMPSEEDIDPIDDALP